LKESEKSILQAKELTQQLLKITQSSHTLEKKTVVLKSVLISGTKFALRGSNITPEFKIEDKLSPVSVDESQFNQVIYNLINNAKEAMIDGGIIEISAENVIIDLNNLIPLAPGEYICVVVKDHGCGIPPENIKKIFDPYFTTKENGHGLGLITSFGIIRNHGGIITVESELGVGTEFKIYLPVTDQKTSLNKNPEVDLIVSGKGHVAVMDDDEGMQKLAQKLISSLGYSVTVTSNGNDLLKVYAEAMKNGKPFDVVILDLTIKGGMGGQKTIELLRQIDPNVKAIVSSGYSREPIVVNYKEYGFSGALPKPYSFRDLSKLLQEITQK
jgi:two-component system cell cycle sensor histidine kinase/response regulator CckA